ncbi:MAG: hypothetical protein ACSLEL_04525 [Candidatus Malihini olakiniferum]
MARQISVVTKDGLQVFYPELKQQLAYPGSYLSDDLKDVITWKNEACQKLRMPDSPCDFTPATIKRKARDDYVADKVASILPIKGA